jgi:uncharacterized protein YwgA
MDKQSIILAALAPAKRDAHTVTQLQKLLFLLDKNIPEYIDGPLFHFEPFLYGPYDEEIFRIIEKLSQQELVEIDIDEVGKIWRTYRLTKQGQIKGEEIFNSLEQVPRKYIEDVSDFVHKVSFGELIAAIYNEYPDMKVNAVFQE